MLDMTIGGESVATSDRFEVFNPATGAVVGTAPNATAADLDRAVAAARAAQGPWAALPDEARAAACRAVAQVLVAHAEELAQLLTREQGKPLNGLGSRWELGGAAAWANHTAGLALPPQVLQDTNEGRVELHRKPIGVVGSITPWNFPVMIAVWHLMPAIRAGNAVVLKPSPLTPLATLRMIELASAVLPAGVLNAVSGDDRGVNIGAAMSAHPGIDKIVFTGSTATGRHVMRSAADTLKRLTLELGGNDAAIVMPDVDLDAVAQKIFFGAFFNTAQICVATKRLYVHEDVYDGLRDRLAGIAAAVKVGDGGEQGTVLGPIQNKRQYDRVMNLLEDARANNLTLIHGADIPDNGGYFIPVTIVDNPPEESRVVQEEAFGPILPMLKFADIDEVIDRANASDYGLAGAVWSKDVAKGIEIARRMETGTIWVNQNLALRPDIPFAGHKQSGFGVENGMEGLLEYMVPQVVNVARG